MAVILIIFIFVLLVLAACPEPYEPYPPVPPPPDKTEDIRPVVFWKGENASAPTGAQPNWTYYNTIIGNAYVYNGTTWLTLPQNGVSLIWKGESLSHPSSPKLNWAYYNSTDEKTYIYSGNEWRELLSGRVVGPEGLLLENMMKQIPAGIFQMGSPASEPSHRSNETQHQITLSNDFYMGRYPVTVWEWYAVMGTTDRGNRLTEINIPVIRISWYDAIEFCNKLSILKGISPAYSLNGETDPDEWGTKSSAWDDVEVSISTNGYRLPTEAEWEYACRAGTNTAFNWGTNQITTDQANYDGSGGLYNGSSKGSYRGGLTPVWGFTPNNWGLYNMHGNVMEWCWDWYGEDYYENSPEQDPQGPISGSKRVARGGSWYAYGQVLRSAWRCRYSPEDRYNDTGFRLARSGE
jgi:formylglycine-generating enzyme required for sulfatase activity